MILTVAGGYKELGTLNTSLKVSPSETSYGTYVMFWHFFSMKKELKKIIPFASKLQKGKIRVDFVLGFLAIHLSPFFGGNGAKIPYIPNTSKTTSPVGFLYVILTLLT